jgi:hypothetical protein
MRQANVWGRLHSLGSTVCMLAAAVLLVLLVVVLGMLLPCRT